VTEWPEFFFELISSMSKSVSDYNERVEVYTHMIEAWDLTPADFGNRCLGIDSAFDDALEELYPDVSDDEDDDDTDDEE
jgi:hypothetical protein